MEFINVRASCLTAVGSVGIEWFRRGGDRRLSGRVDLSRLNGGLMNPGCQPQPAEQTSPAMMELTEDRLPSTLHDLSDVLHLLT